VHTDASHRDTLGYIKTTSLQPIDAGATADWVLAAVEAESFGGEVARDAVVRQSTLLQSGAYARARPLAHMAAGARVRYLQTAMRGWAVVTATSASGQPVRGFVPYRALRQPTKAEVAMWHPAEERGRMQPAPSRSEEALLAARSSDAGATTRSTVTAVPWEYGFGLLFLLLVLVPVCAPNRWAQRGSGGDPSDGDGGSVDGDDGGEDGGDGDGGGGGGDD
jgi:hypothetical protein